MVIVVVVIVVVFVVVVVVVVLVVVVVVVAVVVVVMVVVIVVVFVFVVVVVVSSSSSRGNSGGGSSGCCSSSYCCSIGGCRSFKFIACFGVFSCFLDSFKETVIISRTPYDMDMHAFVRELLPPSAEVQPRGTHLAKQKIRYIDATEYAIETSVKGTLVNYQVRA